jgi:uncharacterized protein
MYSSCVFLGSLTAATFLFGSHAHAGPSFNCNLARMPSEIQICQNPRLSELDNVLAAGYNFIKATRGLQAADAIGIPHWRQVGQCESDRNCIAHRQIEEIVAFRDVGAPISLPDWVTNRAADENSRNPTTEPANPPSVTEPANPPSVRSDPASASGYKSLMDVRIRSRCQSNECGWFMIEESRLLVESPTRSVFALKLKNWHAEYPGGNYNATGALQYIGETTPYVVCSREKPGFVAIDEKGGWGFSEVAPGAHRRSSGYTESALALYWAACHGLNVQDVYETASLATKLGYPATTEETSEVTQISNPTDAILIP